VTVRAHPVLPAVLMLAMATRWRGRCALPNSSTMEELTDVMRDRWRGPSKDGGPSAIVAKAL